MLYIEKNLSNIEIKQLLRNIDCDYQEELDILLEKYKLKKYVKIRGNVEETSKKYKFIPANRTEFKSSYFFTLLKVDWFEPYQPISSFLVNLVINKYYDNKDSFKRKVRKLKRLVCNYKKINKKEIK